MTPVTGEMEMESSLREAEADLVAYVARAMARSDDEEFGEAVWDSYLPMARAAIEAMREPTEAMLFAADWLENGTYAAWQAMIDAALISPAQRSSNHPEGGK